MVDGEHGDRNSIIHYITKLGTVGILIGRRNCSSNHVLFVLRDLAKFERLPLVHPHRYGLYTKDANSDPLSLSYRNTCQPIFPSSPTHAASGLIRDAPRAQSDSRSWTFWIPLMLWSYQHLVSRFSQRCWDARSQES